jgi:ribosomal protein S18 acetylase RimI-like enzyme
MRIDIKKASIEEIVALSRQIPEFDNPHPEEEYTKRLAGKKFLLLIASINKVAVGFKVGYDKENNGSFYSWMGGVLPAYREAGVARELANVQETWARENGFTSIRFKTRNRHKAMLLFGINNGFQIIAVEPREIIAEYRLLLEKKL